MRDRITGLLLFTKALTFCQAEPRLAALLTTANPCDRWYSVLTLTTHCNQRMRARRPGGGGGGVRLLQSNYRTQKTSRAELAVSMTRWAVRWRQRRERALWAAISAGKRCNIRRVCVCVSFCVLSSDTFRMQASACRVPVATQE